MGNEQSGRVDGAASASDPSPSPIGTSSAPGTPRPILRNTAANFQQQQQQQQQSEEKEKNQRRNVVFRDQTEDALRFNNSIIKGGDAGGGLVRLSLQVNNINGRPMTQSGAVAVDDAPAKRLVRVQKPPAPPPPTSDKPQALETQSQLHPGFAAAPTPEAKVQEWMPPAEDNRAVRMREHVFAIAEKREGRESLPEALGEQKGSIIGGGRLYDPSLHELPTLAEEKEEREETSRRSSGLFKTDSKEALREEIKQEILSELLQTRLPSAIEPVASVEPPAAHSKMSEREKRRLITEIRQQLLGDGQRQQDVTNDDTPQPDYLDVELRPGQARLPRFASQMEIQGVGLSLNGYGAGQQVQQMRRFKGPAPAPPNARYRRGGFPQAVRDPYQAQWEEPIFAYDAPQTEQQQEEQMEKAYDDRYRHKSRSSSKSRLGDSWKRMTASLSKAFGIGGSSANGSANAGKSSGMSRRSSVRESTFQQPAGLPPQGFLNGSRAGSVYSLANAEMPPQEPPDTRAASQRRPGSDTAQPQAATQPVDIWRDVAVASHDQMQLHTNNPVFGIQLSASSNGHAGVPSISMNRSPVARVTVPPQPMVNSVREQTYL